MLSNVIDFTTERNKRVRPKEDESFYANSLKAFFKLPLGNENYTGHDRETLYSLFGDWTVHDKDVFYSQLDDSSGLSKQSIYFLLSKKKKNGFWFCCICSGNDGKFSYSDREASGEKAQNLYIEYIKDLNIRHFRHIWLSRPTLIGD